MPKGKKAKPSKTPKKAASQSARAQLYRTLGYIGELPAERRAPTPARRGRIAAMPAAPPIFEPLTPESLRALEREFERDRRGTLAVVRKSLGYPIAEMEFRNLLAKCRQAFDDPATHVAALRGRRKLMRAKDPCRHPDDIPKIDGITVKPCSTSFEGLADGWAWAVNCGPWWLKQKTGQLVCHPMVRHGAGRDFVYSMKAADGAPLGANDTIRIALFSDFATGEYHSRYIAHYILQEKPHYAIHLGDVYYAGIPQEVKAYLEVPLEPLLAHSRVFTMNGNHEMLSGGEGYFKYLQRKQGPPAPGRVEQEQEASYFSLVSDRYQVIAVDTAYDYANDGELKDPLQLEWLGQRLREARDAQRLTILLSQHEPFGLGERSAKPLFEQIRNCARAVGAWPVDYWFWGDEHYCALYRKTERVPFVGSCIGHAGHPVDLREVNRRTNVPKAFAPEQWVDVSPRFKDFREDDLGSAGYCLLELGPNGVKLEYRNWLNKPIYP
jgi:hypothetical protein